MKTLILECDKLEIAHKEKYNEVSLINVNMDFLEVIEPSIIVHHCDNEKLLEQMDADEIMTYLENNYSVEVKEIR